MSRNGLALVTGGNKGLGKETVRQLARRGITVFLGSRDLDRGVAAARDLAADSAARAGSTNSTDGVEVIPIQLDVTDAASLDAAAQRLSRDYGRLDILVHNAGIIVGAGATATSASHLRRTFEVNVFGVVTTIHTLLPLLRRSAAPRIVNVSSTTASMTLTSDGSDLPGDASQRLGYASSKAALNMLTVQYARAFSRDPQLRHIKINSASPGYVATDMN
ncbi:MAG: SDR family NAD(P)-dependent oxidoreductase, partial [Sporichthyaceae bacterium]|nr:SDR family NAD(P)-dependent oxidoreductase [Sporichthyaceae bacterium]